MDFKIGDVVRRIKSSYQGMGIGDIATVHGIEGSFDICLQEYPCEHDSRNFELVEREETVLENYEVY